MFSGRTNGFHNFAEPGMNFPKLAANQLIYVFNTASGQLDSIGIPSYGGDTANVFSSTNLAHTAKDGYLYACGGYGLLSGGDSARTTYSYFMKMQMDSAIAAVQAHNPGKFKRSIVWGQSPMVCSTGGELYILPDNNFYMCVGHKFTGSYTDNTAIQQYVDKINVFSVTNGPNNTLVLTASPNGPITDGQPDSITQFRRRDLVVAPNVLANGTDIGLAIYGGVFTYGAGTPFNSGGNPFPHPIYVDYHQTPSYKVDSYNQPTNVYSTAFISMYDAASKCMITSLFGGLGDSVQNFNNANWSKTISSNIRCFANNRDTTTTYANTSVLPAYIGSESIFIPDAGVTFYNSYGNYKIIDYSSLTNGQTIGRIYGGIWCTTLPAGNNNAVTQASNAVYKIVFNKLEPLTTAK